MAAFKANTKGQNHSICKTGICSVVQRRRRRRLCCRCRRFCLAFHTFSVYLSRIEEPLETPPPPPPKIGKLKRPPMQESTYASPPSMLMQLAAFSPDLLNATTTTSISSVETPQSQVMEVMFLCVPHCTVEITEISLSLRFYVKSKLPI